MPIFSIINRMMLTSLERLEILTNDRLDFLMISHDGCVNGSPILYRRRDFYKISFLDGRCAIHYGDKSLEPHGTSLVFFRPQNTLCRRAPGAKYYGRTLNL